MSLFRLSVLARDLWGSRIALSTKILRKQIMDDVAHSPICPYREKEAFMQSNSAMFEWNHHQLVSKHPDILFRFLTSDLVFNCSEVLHT